MVCFPDSHPIVASYALQTIPLEDEQRPNVQIEQVHASDRGYVYACQLGVLSALVFTSVFPYLILAHIAFPKMMINQVSETTA